MFVSQSHKDSSVVGSGVDSPLPRHDEGTRLVCCRVFVLVFIFSRQELGADLEMGRKIPLALHMGMVICLGGILVMPALPAWFVGMLLSHCALWQN